MPAVLSKLKGLSVAFIAQDEERIIGKTLAAVKDLADEIIVVDSGSTDRTVEIAESFGARVVHQKWLGYAAQKNYAIELAGREWILSLDADEVLTPPLAAEIKSVLADAPADVVGFKIPRVFYIGERAYRYGGFYPDAQLRLFRQGAGRFKERLVHEAITVEGPVRMLHNDMLHYAYTSVEDFEKTMDKYARLSAQEYFTSGYSAWRASPLNEMIHPIWTFFYRFAIRQGFRDGLTGARLNLIYSDYVRKKTRYLRELIEKEDK